MSDVKSARKKQRRLEYRQARGLDLPWPTIPHWPSLTHELDWMKDAACAGLSHLFFGEERADVHAAQTVCRSCPVREQCLAYAERARPSVGVWAGHSAPALATARRKGQEASR